MGFALCRSFLFIPFDFFLGRDSPCRTSFLALSRPSFFSGFFSVSLHPSTADPETPGSSGKAFFLSLIFV
jgi:hypothetical protein